MGVLVNTIATGTPFPGHRTRMFVGAFRNGAVPAEQHSVPWSTEQRNNTHFRVRILVQIFE